MFLSGVFLFVLGCVPLIYTYVVFPFLVIKKAQRIASKSNDIIHHQEPSVKVIVLMAAYNEEAVIKEKLESILYSNYPQKLISIHIGSDASTDRTDDIINSFKEKFHDLNLYRFEGRTGKAQIINSLFEKVDKEENNDAILLLTDANVLLEKDTISILVNEFNNTEIGLCDTHLFTTFNDKEIGEVEATYTSLDSRLKWGEGLVYGKMMGSFGGCYAIRISLYNPVPPEFIVDDFFISMNVILQGYRAITNLDARVREYNIGKLAEEYRRKRRISQGNFMNLAYFWKDIRENPALRYVFTSHKLLRWFGWVFLGMMILGFIMMIISSVIDGKYFLIAAAFVLMILVIVDFMLQQFGRSLYYIRGLRYFLWMNLAMLHGFLDYKKGDSGVSMWEPTKRKRNA